MTAPIAPTTAGKVSGEPFEQGVAFRGIPYAAPPVGSLRFRPPVAPEAWDGVRECTSPHGRGEDCLYLNVWTPGLDHARRPVMLWVATSLGFQGKAFARDGIVLVTASFRSPPFSGLCLDEFLADGTGNLALLDQVRALTWIKENIAEFGGDPDNVTVFGESHGGRNTTSMMVSPFAKGLVRRAIPMSLPRGPFARGEALQAASVRLLDALGVQRGDWDALGAIPTKRLVDVAREVGGGAPMFLIDGVVLPDEPAALVAQGCASEIDVLTGCSLEEARGAMFGGGGLTERQPNRANPDSVRRDIAAWFEGTSYTADELLRIYGSSRPGATELDLLAAIATDHFRIASVRLAEAQLVHHDRVWMYRFSWRTPVKGGLFGAYHWLDTGFAFDLLDERKDVVGDDPPYEVARAFHGAFVRFAATGDPGGGGLPAWPAYDTVRRPVMEFDTTCQLLEDPEPAERQLWEKAHLWRR